MNFRKWILSLCIAVPAMICVFLNISAAEEEDGVRLYCLNVGKADCLILQTGDSYYLIDAGREEHFPLLQAALRELGIEKLNGVFLTHADNDHAGGLLPLSRSGIPVEHWYASAIYNKVEEKNHPARLAAVIRGENVEWLSTGDTIHAGNGAFFAVLGPVEYDTDNENNNSLVLYFSSGDGSILFTGDMKEEEENTLLRKKLITHADVLKVGHHGDNKATTAAFLKLVKPKVSIISTSTYEEEDTPAPSVITRLNTAGSQVYVTQNYSDALLVCLKQGEISTENITFSSLPALQTGISMQIDLKNDTVTVTNNNKENVSLRGCTLLSVTGNESFLLPEIDLLPGQHYVIGSKKTKGQADLILPGKKNIWHKSKRDTAILFDAYGRAVCRANNGKSE